MNTARSGSRLCAAGRAAYPFAFFPTAAYTEDPFLAAVVFTLYFARRGSWRWAALAVWQTLAGLGHRLVAFPTCGSAEANLLLNLVPVVLCMTVVLITIRQIPVSFFYLVGLCYLSISALINGRLKRSNLRGVFLSRPFRFF